MTFKSDESLHLLLRIMVSMPNSMCCSIGGSGLKIVTTVLLSSHTVMCEINIYYVVTRDSVEKGF